MKVLMLGTLVPRYTEKYCFSMGQKTSAADIVQKYMMHGLEQITDIDQIDVIGSVRIKMWPLSKIVVLDNYEESILKGKMYGIGFLNIPLIAFALREKAIIGAAKKWARKNKGETDIVVLIYSMHSPFMKAAREVKRIIPSAKIVLTVADLPLFMDMRGFTRSLMKRIDWYRIKELMEYVDKYLLYTKHMAEYLNLQENQWMVFEGIVDEHRIVERAPAKPNGRFALYAGNLDSRYGIDNLVMAFSKLPEHERLVIYGAGFDQERINELVGPLINVEYGGQLSPDDVFIKMKEATILINPRPANLELAKYSCPSKTFEYMASGTPIIMNPLPGLPDEYREYVYFFSNENVENYAKDIHSLFLMSDEELSEFGMKGADFLRKNKTSAIVMKKAFEFIRG